MDYNTWYQQITEITNHAINTLKNIKLPNNPVMIFDIDDTLIHHSGNCIIQVLQLFNEVKNMGITPIIITNRSGDNGTILFTQKQLSDCNIYGYGSLYFRVPEKENNPYRYKEKARLSVHKRGMNVVMSIGDQNWDIGQYGGIGYILPVFS